MTTLQIILISFFAATAIASLVFLVAFVIEITVEQKPEKLAEKEMFRISENEESIADMLENLNRQTIQEEQAKKKEEVVKESVVEPKIVDKKEEQKVEVEEQVENEVVEQQEEVTEDVADEEVAEAPQPQVIVINENSNIDYEARLAQVLENKENLEKELAKVDNAILKYDRTARRMERNQKMLDRRASELTNLNLVMYSVTDIKNVDEDKKIKQEELTAHIAELKASIQDAEEFLESNKEKNEHNVKMAEFLRKEIARYDVEIAEIKKILDEKAS